MADDKKKGGKFPESILAILIVVILMFALANGSLFRSGGDTTVINNPQVSQQVPASGNLTPQPDYHKDE